MPRGVYEQKQSWSHIFILKAMPHRTTQLNLTVEYGRSGPVVHACHGHHIRTVFLHSSLTPDSLARLNSELVWLNS